MSDTTKNLLAQIGSNGMTALTVLGVLGFLSPEQSTALIAAIHQFNDGLVQTFGALGKMWIILGPLVAALFVKLGISTPTVQNILATLTKAATTGTPDEQKAIQAQIATSTANLPLVTGVVAPVLAADPSTPGNVVANPEVLKPAV